MGILPAQQLSGQLPEEEGKAGRVLAHFGLQPEEEDSIGMQQIVSGQAGCRRNVWHLCCGTDDFVRSASNPSVPTAIVNCDQQGLFRVPNPILS